MARLMGVPTSMLVQSYKYSIAQHHLLILDMTNPLYTTSWRRGVSTSMQERWDREGISWVRRAGYTLGRSPTATWGLEDAMLLQQQSRPEAGKPWVGPSCQD